MLTTRPRHRFRGWSATGTLLGIGTAAVIATIAGGRVVACGGPQAGEARPIETVRQPLVFQGTPIKLLGESCEVYSGSECTSGYCLRIRADEGPNAFVCSTTCRDDSHCPLTWRCAALIATGDGPSFCTPAAGWVAKAVRIRPPATAVAEPR